jgi:hypothetical protein
MMMMMMMMIVYDDDVKDDDAQPMTIMMMMVVGVMIIMIVYRCINPVYHLLHYQVHLYPPTGISTYSSLSFYSPTSSSSSRRNRYSMIYVCMDGWIDCLIDSWMG